MALDPAARAALERRMEERRADLGLRWKDVADAMGITVEGIRGIRKGPSGIPAFTRRALERALRWPTGEVDRILGDTEAPLPSEVPARKEWSAEQRARWKTMSGVEIVDEARRIGENEARRSGEAAGRDARIEYLEAAIAAQDEQRAAIEDSRR